jgi:hypothetical protein
MKLSGRNGLKNTEIREPGFAVLGSGSDANAYVFETGKFSFMVDNGSGDAQ